jgi:hypothetical protein
MNQNFASSAKPFSQLELTANLLTGWKADRDKALSSKNRANALSATLLVLAFASISLTYYAQSNAISKLEDIQASIIENGGEADPEDAPENGIISLNPVEEELLSPEVQAILTDAKASNEKLLIQLGNALVQTKSTVALESLDAESNDQIVRISGSATTQEIGQAHAFIARLAANNPGMKAFLTNVERQPENQSANLRINFELSPGGIQ